MGTALFHWIRSVEEKEEGYLTLQNELHFNPQSLNQLSSVELFTLQAVILHERLTLKEHANIFRLSDQESQYRFDLLVEKGILIAKREAFAVHPLFYRGLVQLLNNKNLLE